MAREVPGLLPAVAGGKVADDAGADKVAQLWGRRERGGEEREREREGGSEGGVLYLAACFILPLL